MKRVVSREPHGRVPDGPYVSEGPPRRVQLDEIQRHLAGHYGIRLSWRVRLGMWWRRVLDKRGPAK